jgi:hypothetical protein
MTNIDDLLYSPITPEDMESFGEKTFKELCIEARKKKQDIEDAFKHLRGKLIVRDNTDGSADIVHKDIAG